MQQQAAPTTKVNRKAVIIYYVIACAVSWPFFWWRDMNSESWVAWHIPNFLKTWTYMWGPGIAAIVCLIIFRKSHVKRVSFFGSSVTKSILFYSLPIFALCIPGIDGQGMNPHLFPLLFGILGFISILGEELGWRGFLQDALWALPPIKKYMLIGVMWELWHFSNRMGHGAVPQIAIRVGIFIIALSIISYLLGKATEKSKSLVVAVTLHAWVDILAENNTPATWMVFGSSLVFWIIMLLKWDKTTSKKDDTYLTNGG